MSSSTRYINVIGDVFADVLASKVEELPTWGTDTLAAISTYPGGSALNSTVHAAYFLDRTNYDIKINIFSAMGNDNFAGVCKKALGRIFLLNYKSFQPHNVLKFSLFYFFK